MAKQSSILSFTGNIGKLSFYKNKDGYMVREKTGVTKARIMTDPLYARTRENMAEFAEAASAVKLLKDALRPAIIRSADKRIHGRLQRAMVKVVKSDPDNSRGARKAEGGNWDLITGLQFNEKVNLSEAFRAYKSVDDTPAALTYNIPPFNPADYMVCPQGTSHFRLFLVGGSMELGTEDHSMNRVATVLYPVVGMTPAIVLSLDKSTLAYSHNVYVFGVEFVQMVNTEESAIQSRQYNAARVIKTEVV